MFPKLGREMGWGAITLDVISEATQVDQNPKRGEERGRAGGREGGRERREGTSGGAGKNPCIYGVTNEGARAKETDTDETGSSPKKVTIFSWVLTKERR